MSDAACAPSAAPSALSSRQRRHPTRALHLATPAAAMGLVALLGACAGGPVATPPAATPSARGPALACDDSLKSAFKPDALTTVVAVQSFKQSDKVFVADSASPVTLAAELCLVKLKVGPGKPGPADARSTSAGIGIEVWLPTPAAWNQRIRNYGGGGYVGGGHLNPANDGATLATAVGSKFPAPVIAGMGYASGTTDAGQPWSQNGSSGFLRGGRLNLTLLKDFSYRSLVEQAVKTRALVKLYYGQAPRYAYFDGHSTGGRQGWKVAQDYPEFYDGYLLAAPAISSARFAMNAFYPQVVMKTDLGYSSVDPAFAAANFQQKVIEANRRAVLACDKPGLGFLLDPFACSYDPAKDHYERVAAAAGGLAEAQKFVRLYLVPGKAHSSQGRGWVVGSAADASRNNSVPLPALPGAGNRAPTREKDQMFTALQDWVEDGRAPGSIILSSRDNSVSYPICVYPQKAVWDGQGSPRVPGSYACR